MVHYAAFISGDANASQECLRLTACVASDRRRRIARSRRLPPPRPDPNKVVRWFFPTGENGFDPVRISGPLFRRRSSRRSSSGCSPTTTSRGRRSSCRWPPRRCPWSPTTARRTRSRSRKGIYFAPDPAFKGKKRELDRAGLRLLVHAVHGSEESARRTRSCSKARSSAWTSSPQQAKQTGKFDYDAKVAGHGGGRSVHAALPAEGDRLQLPLRRRARRRSVPWRAR